MSVINRSVKFFKLLCFTVCALIVGILLSALLVRIGSAFVSNVKKNVALELQNAEAKANSIGLQSIAPLSKTTYIQAQLNVSAEAYIAANLSTGEVLVSKNRTKRLPIASITKLITASVAENLIQGNTLVTITQTALSTEGSSGKLKLNEKLTASDLLYPLLMVSSNDAAEALARAHGRVNFMQIMNSQVKEWGAQSTYFADPSGLSASNTSTPEDLVKIVQAIYNNKKGIIDITKLKTKTVRGHTWVNPTHFLNLSSYVGGKNGYTDEADKTAASIFMIDTGFGGEQPILIVTLRSRDRDKDTLEIIKYLEALGK